MCTLVYNKPFHVVCLYLFFPIFQDQIALIRPRHPMHLACYHSYAVVLRTVVFLETGESAQLQSENPLIPTSLWTLEESHMFIHYSLELNIFSNITSTSHICCLLTAYINKVNSSNRGFICN